MDNIVICYQHYMWVSWYFLLRGIFTFYYYIIISVKIYGIVRNLGSGTVQNPKNWKKYIFSHYFNFIVHNNDIIVKSRNTTETRI